MVLQFKKSPSKDCGFTLIEVMIAVTIMAMIAIMTGQAFSTAITSSEATQEAIDRISKVDRVWVLLETDLRNAIPAVPEVQGQPLIPAVFVDPSEEYRLTVLRGGYANPLRLPRTEMVRVGYRFQEDENTLWRDTWVNIADNDERNAKPRKVLEGIEEVVIRALPGRSNATVSAGPWSDKWPALGIPQDELPGAIEVTLKLEDFGEVRRVYFLLPGNKNAAK